MKHKKKLIFNNTKTTKKNNKQQSSGIPLFIYIASSRVTVLDWAQRDLCPLCKWNYIQYMFLCSNLWFECCFWALAYSKSHLSILSYGSLVVFVLLFLYHAANKMWLRKRKYCSTSLSLLLATGQASSTASVSYISALQWHDSHPMSPSIARIAVYLFSAKDVMAPLWMASLSGTPLICKHAGVSCSINNNWPLTARVSVPSVTHYNQMERSH